MDFLQRKTVRVLFVFLLMGLATVVAVAQTSTTGYIVGSVKDPSGAVISGATVVASGVNLIRQQSATTGNDGTFSILNLPPGRYSVTVEHQGFSKYAQHNIDVNLGRSTTVEIKLELGQTSTEITVNASAVTVDVATATSGTTVSSDQFSYFPTARTVQGLYTIAPTVTRSGLRDASGRDRDPSVGGSSGPENNYILDGVSTSDPAFGGGGANMPFEFVQEVEVKTGAYGAEYGKSTGGIFNVITKSGGNQIHGDVFGFFSPTSTVRGVTNFPFTGSAANGFSEKDIGGDIGGPIVKDKLWYFAAINPQWRTNNYLTQTFHVPVKNDVTIPFYAGKVTWALSNKHILTVSTFSDYTKVDGFIATAALNNISGFGSDPRAFQGTQETGGQNYSFRLNSAFTPTFIGEFSGGLHFQRNNLIPLADTLADALVVDSFSVLKDDAILPVTSTGVLGNAATGFVDFVDGRGGSLQRTYVRGDGFGLYQHSDRNRYEFSGHLQNTLRKHSIKYGYEWSRNIYNNINTSSGGAITYANPGAFDLATPDSNQTINQRVTNNFSVCTVRTLSGGNTVICPSATAVTNVNAAFSAGKLPADITGGAVQTGCATCTEPALTQDEAFNNPFIVRTSTRVRDFELHANTYTNVNSMYIQDDWRLMKNLQLNLGLRTDLQEGYDTDGKAYIKLNQFWHDTQPRLGVIWDFTGSGKGKFSFNYARFVETPIPLDVNVRAGGGDSQTDKNMNVDTLNAPATANLVCCTSGFGAANLGAAATPIDPGLRPQTMEEYSTGFEFAPTRSIVLGLRGFYRNYVNIIEDGSFDDGNNYFLFNPGRRSNGETTEDKACADPTIGCFGPARRYYRGMEVTATKRFTQHYQFIASYTYSSLIGNYEGLFRNDNGQTDPNITSLFDLVSLLKGDFGRLPNDRPHQFKFNGSYETPFKLMLSGNFYLQSGSPFNELTPHAVYGNNEGFGFCDNPSNPSNPNPGVCVPRGTAVVPVVGASQAGFPNVVDSIGTNRTPVTFNLDLGFYYPIKIKEHMEFRLSADWFNATNAQRAVTLDQTSVINSGVSGVNPVTNPFWGSAQLVQPPSQWRFGAKFSF